MIQDDGLLEIDLDDPVRNYQLLVLQLGETGAVEWLVAVAVETLKLSVAATDDPISVSVLTSCIDQLERAIADQP